MAELSHIDSSGRPSMVEVGSKATTRRSATAQGYLAFSANMFDALEKAGFQTAKGAMADVATIAAIQAVKQTSALIPLCHPLPVTGIKVNIVPGALRLNIECQVNVDGKTGVEMEALTGVSIAALTLYDMCKALGHDMHISGITLVEKTGGKSDVKKDH